MPRTAGLLNHFPSHIRDAGEDLFYESLITLRSGKIPKSTVVEAWVNDGTVRHHVVVRRRSTSAEITCTCSRVRSQQACAHIWAALLEANASARYSRRIEECFQPAFVDHLDDITSGLESSWFDEDGNVGPSDDPTTEDAHLSANSRLTRGPSKPTDSGRIARGEGGRKEAAPVHPSPPSLWKSQLRRIASEISMRRLPDAGRTTDPMSGRPLRIAYFVSPGRSGEFPVDVEVLASRIKRDGAWGKWKKTVIEYDEIDLIEDAEDASVLKRLLGTQDWRVPDYGGGRTSFLLRSDVFRELAPGLASRGVLFGPDLDAAVDPKPAHLLSRGHSWHQSALFDPTKGVPLQWDDGGAWTPTLSIRPHSADGQTYETTVSLRRGTEELPTKDAIFFPCGFALARDQLLEIEGEQLSAWAGVLVEPLEVPRAELGDFVATAAQVHGCPSISPPEELPWKEVADPPAPRLFIAGPGEVPSFHADFVRLEETQGAGDGVPPQSGSLAKGGSPSKSPSRSKGGPPPGTGSPTDWQEEDLPRGRLAARLEYVYGSVAIDSRCPDERVVAPDHRTLVIRHRLSEAEQTRTLVSLGFRKEPRHRNEFFTFRETDLPRIAQNLHEKGWEIWAKDARIRATQDIHTRVSSGIDWFGVTVRVAYEGSQTIDLQAILAALRKGERMVRLGDGSVGFLPEEWMKRNGLLLDMGKASGEELRFDRHQAPLLDALLADQPRVDTDEAFDRIRTELRSFRHVEPVRAPKTFQAELRPYQEASLGWFDFLRQFGFGGCLADDMGLGKTIMALALLDSRRTVRGQTDRRTSKGPAGLRPSLVVVPRSLAFNWTLEAGKFAPKLRILDHSGSSRGQLDDSIRSHRAHVVLTTYGVLRRDIDQFREVEFDYVILDESQAIKNNKTSTSKAVRLLQARHRLALSGTPVENHIGELWSLFAFLNPGLLGSSQKFYKWATMKPEDTGGAGAARGAETTEEKGAASASSSNLLSAAVRPFILRRTKGQVAPQLPDRTEQTVYCTLEPKQRKFYESLRAHYESELLGEGTTTASGKNKALLVLEGLLRLRQAACHPALIAPEKESIGSPKLDLLVAKLEELRAEGNKALVFSQFVSLLTLVRTRLDAAGVRYEYLDGRTRNRARKVDRFQNDPELDAFLISLKAGGTGLNLTAATYVFLLDPWWNPAVEAQAIDRVHRIGQTRSVFACRIVARDTIEEKVLELQSQKRELANSIIQEDTGGMKDLRPEDLEFLFR